MYFCKAIEKHKSYLKHEIIIINFLKNYRAIEQKNEIIQVNMKEMVYKERRSTDPPLLLLLLLLLLLVVVVLEEEELDPALVEEKPPHI